MGFDRSGFYQQIGFRLAAVRKKRGFTQEQVARSVGIPRATYASIEGGRQRIVADVLWRLAIIFEVAVADLFPERVVVGEAVRASPPWDGVTRGNASAAIPSFAETSFLNTTDVAPLGTASGWVPARETR